MTIDLGLRCSECGDPAYADDEYCEACGAPFAAARDSARDHLEVDAGVAAGVTDRGLTHRRNDDALFVATNGDAVVAVVCDGVSTSAAPQIAALLAANVIGHALLQITNGTPTPGQQLPASTVAAAIALADEQVRLLSWRESSDRGPACTVVAALWDGVELSVAWAGDSRAYWISSDGSELLTVDHSWTQEQVAAGLMTEADAAADARSHVITRWIGEHGLDDGPGVVSLVPRSPGRLVVCTDGLWAHVPNTSELSAMVLADAGRAPLEIARSLTETAVARGGTDNVTVAVIEVRPGDERQTTHREGAPT